MKETHYRTSFLLDMINYNQDYGLPLNWFLFEDNYGYSLPMNKELKTTELENIVKSMEKSIIEMWSSPEKMLEYSKNAREHARKTHDKEKNFAKLQEIYAKIAERQG